MPTLALLAFLVFAFAAASRNAGNCVEFFCGWHFWVRDKEEEKGDFSQGRNSDSHLPPGDVTGVGTVLGNPCSLGGGRNGNDWSVSGNAELKRNEQGSPAGSSI